MEETDSGTAIASRRLCHQDDEKAVYQDRPAPAGAPRLHIIAALSFIRDAGPSGSSAGILEKRKPSL